MSPAVQPLQLTVLVVDDEEPLRHFMGSSRPSREMRARDPSGGHGRLHADDDRPRDGGSHRDTARAACSALRVWRSWSLGSTWSITPKTISTGRSEHAGPWAAPRQNLLHRWRRGSGRRFLSPGRPLPQRPAYLISPDEEPARPVAAPQAVEAFKGGGCLFPSEAL